MVIHRSKNYILMLSLASFATLTMCAGPVPAQAICSPAEEAIETLKEGWGEHQMFTFERTSSGRTHIMFVNIDTGSWTQTVRDGELICYLASGTNFTFDVPQIEGDDNEI